MANWDSISRVITQTGGRDFETLGRAFQTFGRVFNFFLEASKASRSGLKAWQFVSKAQLHVLKQMRGRVF